MTAVGLGQQGSEATGPGSSLSCAKCFYDVIDICQKFHSNGSHGTMSGTTGFRSGRYGFESQALTTLFNLIITTENRDTAPPSPPMHKIFRYPKFSETPEGSPATFFGTVRQTIFDSKS